VWASVALPSPQHRLLGRRRPVTAGPAIDAYQAVPIVGGVTVGRRLDLDVTAATLDRRGESVGG
jgi:hypothetical protein